MHLKIKLLFQTISSTGSFSVASLNSYVMVPYLSHKSYLLSSYFLKNDLHFLNNFCLTQTASFTLLFNWSSLLKGCLYLFQWVP